MMLGTFFCYLYETFNKCDMFKNINIIEWRLLKLFVPSSYLLSQHVNPMLGTNSTFSAKSTSEEKSSIYTDTLVFHQYLLKDGVAFLRANQKDEKLLFSLKNDLKRGLVRGDVIEVKWQYDKNDAVVVTTNKISDGPVSDFRSQYPKPPLVTWNDVLPNDDIPRQQLIQTVENYLVQTTNTKVKEALQKEADLVLELEPYVRYDKKDVLISVGDNLGDYQQLIVWLVYKMDSDELFEYDYELDELKSVE